MAFVAGEAGIGKSYLVTALVAAARTTGLIVATGGCPIRSEGELPLAAPIEAWRSLHRSLVLPLGDEVAAAVGDLDVRMSGGASGSASDDSTFGQVRLLDSWATALGAIGDPGRPMLLVFEDVHWADPGTRDLISYLARTCRDAHVMVIVTYRSDDLGIDDPLRSLLAELVRLPWTERIELPRLSPDDVASIAADHLGHALEASELASLARRSGGVPYYVEELLDRGDSGGPPPTTIREHLLWRVSAVSGEVRTIVGLVAAVGRPCRPRLIAIASGLPPMIAAAAMEDALRRRLLARITHGDEPLITTHHELLRETIEYEILRSGGFEFHRLIAEALSAEPLLGGSTELEQSTLLADQAVRAGLRSLAADASVRAARAAETLFAFEEAASRYATALDLRESDDQADGIDLRRRLAEAAFLAGNPATAVAALEPVVDLLLETGDLAEAAMSLGRLGRFKAADGDARAALADLDRALVILRSADRSDLSGRVYLAQARILIDQGRSSDAEAAAGQALHSADQADDPADACTALELLGVVAARRGALDTAAEFMGRATARRRASSPAVQPRPSRIGDILLEYADRAMILDRTGHSAEAAELLATGAARAEALGAGASWGAYLAIDAARQAAEQGRFGDALATIATIPEASARKGGVLLDVVTARIAAAQGRFNDAQAALARLDVAAGASQEPGVDRAIVTAEVAVWRGQPEAALTIATNATRRLVDDDDRQLLAELLVVGLRAAGDLAELARFRRRPAELEAVLELATPLEAAARAAPATPAGTRNESLIALARAEAGRLHEADPRSWDEAVSALEQSEDRYRAAYARWRRAESNLAGPDPDRRRARADLVDANAVGVQIGADPLVREIEDLARRARLSLEPSTAPPETVEVARDQPGPGKPDDAMGLSARELEVLALIVDGRTNRQIAETLFITEKTAAHHVSNVLGKLDVSTRGEAGAMARRLRLVPETAPEPRL
jgi:DNA-binding CsgD family transcriptional regulator/tetratricopeptide (TPR) repeat protein